MQNVHSFSRAFPGGGGGGGDDGSCGPAFDYNATIPLQEATPININ